MGGASLETFSGEAQLKKITLYNMVLLILTLLLQLVARPPALELVE